MLELLSLSFNSCAVLYTCKFRMLYSRILFAMDTCNGCGLLYVDKQKRNEESESYQSNQGKILDDYRSFMRNIIVLVIWAIASYCRVSCLTTVNLLKG